MRLLIQKVKGAQVVVEGKVVGKINAGLLVFLGVHSADTLKECQWVKEKLLDLRIFPDEAGKLNLSLRDVGAELLVVSQFTLYADCSKGRRPSFTDAAPPEMAKKLYEQFVNELKETLPQVQTGEFGAHMEVSLINDGPLTFIVDSPSCNLPKQV